MYIHLVSVPSSAHPVDLELSIPNWAFGVMLSICAKLAARSGPGTSCIAVSTGNDNVWRSAAIWHLHPSSAEYTALVETQYCLQSFPVRAASTGSILPSTNREVIAALS